MWYCGELYNDETKLPIPDEEIQEALLDIIIDEYQLGDIDRKKFYRFLLFEEVLSDLEDNFKHELDGYFNGVNSWSRTK